MTEKSAVRQEVEKAIENLLIMVPRAINRSFEPNADRYPLVVKATPVLIIILSVASVATIDTRVMAHHSGWNSPLIAFAAATMVPIATLFAALTTHKRWSILFWFVSFFFAALSGAIQYGVYAPKGDSNAMMIVEAAAFGFGLPVAEVLMAIMEAVSIREWRKSQEDAKRSAAAEAENARIKSEHLAESRRKEEAARKKEELAAQVEAERLQALAAIEIEAARAEAELARRKAEEAINQSTLDREAARQARLLKAGKKADREADREVIETAPSGPSDADLALSMVDGYHENSTLSDVQIANQNSIPRSRVIRVRNWLSDQGVIDIQSQGPGKPNIITVNGNEGRLRSGEIKP